MESSSVNRRTLLKDMESFLINRRTLLKGSLALTAVGTLAACSGSQTSGLSSGSSGLSKTLVYVDAITPPGFDDDTSGADDASENIVSNCYGGDIVRYEVVKGPEGVLIANMTGPGVRGGILNGFAETVDVSKDLRTFTFHLRRDAKSSFGNSLSADDVIWSFSRNLALGQTGAFMANAMSVTKPEQLTKIDERTVRFELPAPSPLFLKVDAIKIYSGLADSKTAKAHATSEDPWARKWLSTNTAGYGPYTVEKSVKGEYVHFKRNPGYTLAKPSYDRVVWQATPTSANRLALLKSGNADVAVKLTPPQLKAVQETPGLTVTSYEANQFKSIQLNTKYAPLADPRVRQAIAYAIPYDQILESVYLGTATPVHSPLPASYPGYTDKYWKYATNLDKARSLMKSAGVGAFDLTLTYSNDGYDDVLIAPIVRSALKDIGISVKLDGLPVASFSEKLYSRKGQACLQVNWPLVAHPGYALGVYWKSSSFLNVGSWSNKEFDDLVSRMLIEPDDAKMLTYADRAQEIYEAEQPWILLANPGWHVAHSSKVTGVTWYPNNGIHFDDLART